MKKIIEFLLAFLLIASFAACGDSDTADTVHTENAIADAFAQLIEQISQNGGYISLSTEENLLSYLGIETEGFIISGFDVIIDGISRFCHTSQDEIGNTRKRVRIFCCSIFRDQKWSLKKTEPV